MRETLLQFAVGECNPQDSNNSSNLVFLIRAYLSDFRQIFCIGSLRGMKEINGKNPNGSFYRNQRNFHL
jgi:hypothetical protein